MASLEDATSRLADQLNNSLLAAVSRTTQTARPDPQSFAAAHSLFRRFGRNGAWGVSP